MLVFIVLSLFDRLSSLSFSDIVVQIYEVLLISMKK